MPIPQEGNLPAFFTLEQDMRVRITAIDAVSGALVAGVKISNASIDVDSEAGQGTVPPEVLNPALLPGEQFV